MLEAWLVLTSVKYHGNLYILIPLNQRLALTRLRATGPRMKEVLLNKVFQFHFTEVGYPVSSYSQVENWSEPAITAAAEPAFEPAILALGSWGPGADPFELVSSEPAT